MATNEYKPVKFLKVDHETLEEMRLEVAMERGVSTLSLPQLIMEMAKFYKENRQKA